MAIAPERNPPINPEYYQPRRYQIEDITLGVTTLVTTTVDHDYVIGQTVRLLVPNVYGSYQISGQQGQVVSIPASDEVIVNINSIGSNPFISMPSYGPNPPQILAIGDVNSGYISNNGPNVPSVTIPGSFINISPL